jgi:FtsH-binding integral membrane protein
MRELLAVILFASVFALSFIHFQWSRGSHWPEESEEALARAVIGDGRRSMPSPLACLALSIVLAVVALWPLFVMDRATELSIRQVTMVIAGTFVARGIAGYTVRWRQHFNDEPFATRDRRYYSPLCLVLGLGYAAFAAGELG